MWYDDLPKGSSWDALWFPYIICGNCSGIRRLEAECPGCGDAPPTSEPFSIQNEDGRVYTVGPTYMGAEGRYEDYIYLQMLQREWERPAPEFKRIDSFSGDMRPSARSALVLLFWSYFETRIERLLRQGLRAVPERVRDDLLDRYSSIGARLYQLYKISFGKTYFEDLSEFGFDSIATLLNDVHKRRNDFAHGQPQAIDDKIVVALVNALKEEHEAWIAIFNRRASYPGGGPPISR